MCPSHLKNNAAEERIPSPFTVEKRQKD